MSQKTILVIMDGWGATSEAVGNAIHHAHTPFVDSLYQSEDTAYCTLSGSGEAVGLPEGQMGNSEVGHLNIGAGRVVYQDITRINRAIETGEMEQNPVLNDAFSLAKEKGKDVHFLGLVSDGGVHSLTRHLKKLTDMAEDAGIERSFVHALTDGRDTDPRSGLQFVEDLHQYLQNRHAKIASVCGRYYTMDRDKRWDRIRKGYDLLVHGTGAPFKTPAEAIKASYDNQITDEFIEPAVICDENHKPLATIKPGDMVICFNFRTDRLRQITTALTQNDMPEHDMKALKLHYLTMTRYDESFENVHVVFNKQDLKNTLGEVLAHNKLPQLRIAETEKYAHVTFFFSGGREGVFHKEDRIMIPSPKVPTYDKQPEMSAKEVKDAVIHALGKDYYQFICLNFANPDMVGHTGVFPAIIKAVETVDSCVKEVCQAAIKSGYAIMLTSDHGNAEHAINDNGSANTAHTTNPVPFFLINARGETLRKDGILADIAPTALDIMDLPAPEEMTGKSLVEK